MTLVSETFAAGAARQDEPARKDPATQEEEPRNERRFIRS